MAKIGRMYQTLFMAPPDLVKAIEDFRSAHEFDSRGAAIRTLVEEGLKALKEKERTEADENVGLAA